MEEKAEARRAYMAAWRAKNRDHIRAYKKEWSQKNPDRIREYNLRYWITHKVRYTK